VNRKDLDTGREYALPRGTLLLSSTDHERRIAYCNQALIEASGYTRDELIGQSAYLLDHSDMPPEVLHDLWATLDAGTPWSGIVKSRRKNGDHFWVRATIAPVLEGRYRVGCTIVRTAALRAQVEAADALYAAMRQKATTRCGTIEAAADPRCTRPSRAIVAGGVKR
jgi:aerotaxis receptor